MIEDILVRNAAWAVPVALLLLQFLMKTLVAKDPNGAYLWTSLLQTPLEIGFLALSFTATVLLREPQRAPFAFGVCVVYIILLIICIALWRLSPDELVRSKVIRAVLLTILNFALTLTMLVYAIELLTAGGGRDGA